ncbi:MAG: HPr family phosphocarrier protein [Clostridiales bacterium]|nr:HPr family phosphocarrier protein [Clostridiales bacterium]
MVRREIRVGDKQGLHLRPAGALVGEANAFSSHVMLIHGEHRMNCKSLMSLLAFPVCPGDDITVECDGEDEAKALESICAFFRDLDQWS